MVPLAPIALATFLVSLPDVVTVSPRLSEGTHERPIKAVSFSNDGRLILSRCSNATKLWEVATGKERASITPGGILPDISHQDISHQDFSNEVVLISDKGFVIWNTWTEESREIRTPGGTLCVACSPVNHLIATSQGEGIVVYDMGGELRYRFEGAKNRAPLALAFSGDGRLLSEMSLNGKARRVRVWEIESRTKVCDLDLSGYASQIFTFDSTNQFLLLGGSGRIARINVKKNHVSFMGDFVVGNTITWNCAACSLCGGFVVAGVYDGSVALWDLRSRKLKAILNGHGALPRCIAFSPDATSIVCGMSFEKDGAERLLVWDVSTITGLNALQSGVSVNRRDKKADHVKNRQVREWFDSTWHALGDASARTAHSAARKFAGAGEDSAYYIASKMHPVDGASKTQQLGLIRDLDSEDYRTREIAYTRLRDLNMIAANSLADALASPVSREAGQRLKRLQSYITGPLMNLEVARRLRALEVLEHMGTAVCVEALERVAQGDARALETQHAVKALQRLKRASSVSE